jgi:hypothetical protein
MYTIIFRGLPIVKMFLLIKATTFRKFVLFSSSEGRAVGYSVGPLGAASLNLVPPRSTEDEDRTNFWNVVVLINKNPQTMASPKE